VSGCKTLRSRKCIIEKRPLLKAVKVPLLTEGKGPDSAPSKGFKFFGLTVVAIPESLGADPKGLNPGPGEEKPSLQHFFPLFQTCTRWVNH
jgi:hypothetical protein